MEDNFRSGFVMRKFIHDRSGGALVYGSFAMMLLVGATLLAFDIGRLTVLRTEMQNRADAGAMGGAAYLNGSTGARTRAETVARQAMFEASPIPGDDSELDVSTVKFFSQYFPTGVEATTDLEAVYIEVILEPRRVDYFFGPLLSLLTGTGTPASGDMHAIAVAGPDPYICNAPPLMICSLAEEDPSLDFFDPVSGDTHIGKQIVLKEPQGGNATMAPGNFGLLALPDGSLGANDIEDALAAVEPNECYTLDVTTAPGSKTNKVKEGINARFDLPGNGFPYPAPNVKTYTRDSAVAADPQNVKIGAGDWGLDDIGGYWDTHHGTVLPADLAGASRYQVYLYELGLPYLRDGKKTVHPVPPGYDPLAPPAEYATYDHVEPAAASIPADASFPDDPNYDGVPSETVASNGFARRLMTVAVLDCIADDVRGTGTYPSYGRYIDMFITEYVPDPPDAAIFGEVVQPVTSLFSPDFHANVRLVK